jgi:NADPH:quinone reductase
VPVACGYTAVYLGKQRGKLVARAIILNAYGGPEELVLESVEVAAPGAAEVLIRQTGIGVNFIDTYCRRGLSPVPLPAIIGNQAVGIVEEVGSGVTEFSIGDRVGYGASDGAYVEARVIKTKDIVRLPDGVTDDVVAATLTRGMTAEYLLYRLYELKAGDTAIVHAATGGTGLIVCQWARHIGATVIVTVGSKSKIETAAAAGADHVLLHDAAHVHLEDRAKNTIPILVP